MAWKHDGSSGSGDEAALRRGDGAGDNGGDGGASSEVDMIENIQV